MKSWMAVLALGAAGLFANPVNAAEQRPVVVELFTSQGCSSCPPADKLLGELANRPDVLALSFHVDYWDRLGWKDPYSSRTATDRQRTHDRRLRTATYTPQLVVDGAAETVGSNRASVAGLIDRARQSNAEGPRSSLRWDGKQWIAEIGAAGEGASAARVLLVSFDAEHSTAVGRGENGGRMLSNYNVVRSFREVGRWSGDAARLAIETKPEDVGERFALLVEREDGAIASAALAERR